MQLLHGCFQQFLCRQLNVTEVADFRGAHFGIAGQFGAGETLELAFASCLHALANGSRVFDLAFVGEFFVIDAGDFDVDVDAVEERVTVVLEIISDDHPHLTGRKYRQKFTPII